jgi:hypothetical protein
MVVMTLLVVVGNGTHLLDLTNASSDAGLNVVADEPNPRSLVSSATIAMITPYTNG